MADLEDVVRFLDHLSGMDLPQEIRSIEQEWRRKYSSTYRPAFLKKREGETASD